MAEPEEEQGGVPEWVVTYGDMMSLLLTFFIMLVSMSELKMKDVAPLLQAGVDNLGFELVKHAVFVNGQPVGDQFDELGMKEGMALVQAVNEVNGLSDEGND